MLQLNLEQPCDLNCIHCKRNYLLKLHSTSIKTKEKIIGEIEEHLIKNPNELIVKLIGNGEPTLLPGFLELCTYIRVKGLDFIIESHGLNIAD
jgi:MoaA/NifB/PqqE/SkfB family radical SAM enzyme